NCRSLAEQVDYGLVIVCAKKQKKKRRPRTLDLVESFALVEDDLDLVPHHLRGRPPGDSAGLQLGYVLAMEFQHGEILRLKALALSSRALILEGPEEQQ